MKHAENNSTSIYQIETLQFAKMEHTSNDKHIELYDCLHVKDNVYDVTRMTKATKPTKCFPI